MPIQRIHAATLIELLFVIAIFCLTANWAVSTAAKIFFYSSATVNLRIIQNAITYAKSLAVLNQQSITVCGSYNGFSCHENWQGGILVLGLAQHTKFFKLQSTQNALLTLQQSGSSNKQVIIHPNTMTYTNGHFTYKSTKASDMPAFKLYFNRALRFYIRMDV